MVAILFWLAVVIAAVAGWILNIVALVHSAGFTGLMVARAIGVFMFPLGVVLGYV